MTPTMPPGGRLKDRSSISSRSPFRRAQMTMRVRRPECVTASVQEQHGAVGGDRARGDPLGGATSQREGAYDRAAWQRFDVEGVVGGSALHRQRQPGVQNRPVEQSGDRLDRAYGELRTGRRVRHHDSRLESLTGWCRAVIRALALLAATLLTGVFPSTEPGPLSRP